MKKIHKILIPVLSVVLILSIVALVLSFNSGFLSKLKGSNNIDDFSSVGFKGDDFAALNSTQELSEYPIMQSDFDSIFYSVKPDKSVVFYKYDGTALKKYGGEVNTIDLKPECTYNKIPIKIYYITIEDKTLGYGLFTNEDSDITLYSYVFAKLIDEPAIYGLKGKMLLLCTDEDQAFNLNKTYTEVFNVDMSKASCNTITLQRDRNADRSGRLSERWSIFTDDYLKTASKKAGMISGRLYDAKTEMFDIYDLKKGINSPAVKGIYTTFLREASDGGYIYLKQTKDGFKSVKYITNEKTIAEFKGDVENDFIFSGDWVYSKNEKTFTNLLTAKKIVAEKLDTGFNLFCANKQATKIAAFANGQNQAFIIINEDGSVKQYAGNLIFNPSIENVCFIDENTVFSSSINSDSACKNSVIKIG